MINNPVGFVICRIGAVFVAVSTLSTLSFAIGPLLDGPVNFRYLLMLSLIVFAPLVAAFLLWVYAGSISDIPFAAPRPTTIGDFNSEELIGIGMHLIGIYILAFGVISMFSTEALALAQSSWSEDNEKIAETMSAHTISRRVSYVIQIVVGFALLNRGKKRLVL